MINIKIATSVCKSIHVEHITTIWIKPETVYFLTDKADAVTVWDLERKISELEHQSENRLKGINYWKNKATKV